MCTISPPKSLKVCETMKSQTYGSKYTSVWSFMRILFNITKPKPTWRHLFRFTGTLGLAQKNQLRMIILKAKKSFPDDGMSGTARAQTAQIYLSWEENSLLAYVFFYLKLVCYLCLSRLSLCGPVMDWRPVQGVPTAFRPMTAGIGSSPPATRPTD